MSIFILRNLIDNSRLQ